MTRDGQPMAESARLLASGTFAGRAGSYFPGALRYSASKEEAGSCRFFEFGWHRGLSPQAKVCFIIRQAYMNEDMVLIKEKIWKTKRWTLWQLQRLRK